jgi:tRNA pseudouridine55 synthase
VVDKPVGPTSHDVVSWTRRALGTKAVGHAGTLDPFASGVLVVLVGDATKLASYATNADKAYRTELSLGTETDTLDREGNVIDEQPVPSLNRAQIEAALTAMTGLTEQLPPRFSAIKKDGVRHYERARRGEEVEVEARSVILHAVTLRTMEPARLELELQSGKGYYVRSFGRDLAHALGTCGHLSALRRLRSGNYALDQALDGERLRAASKGDLNAQAEVRAHLVPITRTTIPLPVLDIDAQIASELRCGKKPTIERVPQLGDGVHLAFEGETPIAIVERREGVVRVLRGMC